MVGIKAAKDWAVAVMGSPVAVSAPYVTTELLPHQSNPSLLTQAWARALDEALLLRKGFSTKCQEIKANTMVTTVDTKINIGIGLS